MCSVLHYDGGVAVEKDVSVQLKWTFLTVRTKAITAKCAFGAGEAAGRGSMHAGNPNEELPRISVASASGYRVHRDLLHACKCESLPARNHCAGQVRLSGDMSVRSTTPRSSVHIDAGQLAAI
jgi:hypothetical protein